MIRAWHSISTIETPVMTFVHDTPLAFGRLGHQSFYITSYYIVAVVSSNRRLRLPPQYSSLIRFSSFSCFRVLRDEARFSLESSRRLPFLSYTLHVFPPSA